MRKPISALMILCLALTIWSCEGASRQQRGTATGAAVGAGLGAILGQVIGRDTQGTLWGAAIGATLGGIAGNQIGAYMDRQERELEAVIDASNASAAQAEAASIQRTEDVLTATFKSEMFFDYDSATLKPGAYSEIARVADVLNRYPHTTIQVEGHTDAKGSEQYNQQLSERRAQAVMNALAQRGVDPRRMQAMGYGETQPISSIDAANRRVSIVITPVRAS